jgi:hypothetical protein
VSTNHVDFLKITVPINRDKVDKITIATSHNDHDTIEFCAQNGIDCLICDYYLRQNGSKFNRGAVYNWIFSKRLAYKDWILLLDSDVVLLDDYKEITKNLNKEYFFGARRWNIETYADWVKVRDNPDLLNNNNYTLFRGAGYGYFQLFNYQSQIMGLANQLLHDKPYPELPTNSEGDWIFRNYWGDMVYHPDFNLKGHQELNDGDYGTNLFSILPQRVIHLGVTGINNSTRTTPEFK